MADAAASPYVDVQLSHLKRGYDDKWEEILLGNVLTLARRSDPRAIIEKVAVRVVPEKDDVVDHDDTPTGAARTIIRYDSRDIIARIRFTDVLWRDQYIRELGMEEGGARPWPGFMACDSNLATYCLYYVTIVRRS